MEFPLKDKVILWPYFYNGSPCTGKTVFILKQGPSLWWGSYIMELLWWTFSIDYWANIDYYILFLYVYIDGLMKDGNLHCFGTGATAGLHWAINMTFLIDQTKCKNHQLINRFVNQSTNQSVSQLIDHQSINQRISQPISQVNYSANQWIHIPSTSIVTYHCLSGKLWYLQHNCVGDTIVYH